MNDMGVDVERILDGPAQPVGAFRFYFAGERWEWSPEVAAMHGYKPGTVEVTTQLLLAHKHPDDRQQVQRALFRSLETRTPFSSRHRIIDTAGQVHHVVVISDAMTDAEGTLVGTEGFYIDLTDFRTESDNAELESKVHDFAVHRAVIEQAKGMIMMGYNITDQQAFDVLVWRSQQVNVKVRDLATSIVARTPGALAMTADNRSALDHILLTAHHHILVD
jgi:PAS domain S-box-containing protein